MSIADLPTEEPALSDPNADPPPPPLGPGRVARLLITIASGWMRTVATLVIGFVSTPILFNLLGDERMGVIKISEQWFAYLEFLSMGLGGVVTVLLIKASTTGAETDVWGTIKLGMRLFARQLVWIFPLSVILVAVFPFAFKLLPELRAEFYWASPAILLAVLMAPVIVFRMDLDVRQRGYLINVAFVANTAIAAGLGIALALAGFGLTGLVYATTVGLLAFSLTVAGFCGAFHKSFWQVPVADPPTGEQVWRLRWPLLVVGVAYQISQVSDNILAGFIFGVGEVAAFAFTQRLLITANSFGGILGGAAAWAGLIELRARVGPEAFRVRLIEVSKLAVGVNLMILAPVLGYNGRFVSLWLRPDLYAGDLLTVTTFLQLAVFTFVYIYSSMIDGLGDTRKRVWVSVLGTLIKLALVAPFAWWFGVAGLPLATVVGCLATDAWFCPRIVCREYGVSARQLGAALIRATAVGGLWAAICYLIGTRSIGVWPGWIGLTVEMATLEMIGIGVIWFVLLSRADQDLWKRRFRGWFGINSEPAVVK